MASSPSPTQPHPPLKPIQKAIFSYFSRQSTGKTYEVLPEAQHLFPPSHPTTNLVFEDRVCEIEDVRGREQEFALDEHGFCFWRYESQVKDLRDEGQIEEIYIPEIRDLVRRILGMDEGVDGGKGRVVVFGWKVRSSQTRKEEREGGISFRRPTIHPHVDQSSSGAVRRLHHHLPNEADELLKGRFRIINIWRPLQTVTAYPLALCDARSVRASDLIPKEQIGTTFMGESYLAKYNEKHKWYYLRGMEMDEAVVMKIYDSRERKDGEGEGGGVDCCVHSSFEWEGKEEGKGWVGMRESIEVRVMVFDEPGDGKGRND